MKRWVLLPLASLAISAGMILASTGILNGAARFAVDFTGLGDRAHAAGGLNFTEDSALAHARSPAAEIFNQSVGAEYSIEGRSLTIEDLSVEQVKFLAQTRFITTSWGSSGDLGDEHDAWLVTWQATVPVPEWGIDDGAVHVAVAFDDATGALRAFQAGVHNPRAVAPDGR